MANIKPAVDKIRGAVYGEEVRESIAGAIELINAQIDSKIDDVEVIDGYLYLLSNGERVAGPYGPFSGPGGGGGSGTHKGIASVTQYYLSAASPYTSSVTHSTSGWTTTRPTPTSSNMYVWTYTDITLEDGTSVKTAPILLGNYNERLGTISVMFLRNSSSTAPSTSASGWSTTSTEPTASQPYVWCYIRLTYYAYGTASSHYVNSRVFRLKTYQAPASSGESAGGMVLESNGCGGWQCGGTNISGTDILSDVQKGLMPVMYIGGFYAPVICVESTTQDGMDAIRMWYYYGGCSTPALVNTTVVV